MSPTATTIPYEKQFDPQATRTCGAACLTMVYRSLGQEVPQGVIWPLIAKKNQYGSVASTTHLMAADALTRGFSAVAMQARHPLQILRVCRDSGIRAILNHRLKPDSPAGHYTVFLDIDDTHVTLHDPYFGPARRISHDTFLDLWQARLPNSEIVGNFLIGVAPAPPPPEPSAPTTSASKPCDSCNTALPSAVQCPRCKNPVALQPVTLLGCLNQACSTRLWNYVCCPTCDLTWNFTIEPPRAAAAPSASAITTASEASPTAAPPPSLPRPSAVPSDIPSLTSALDLPELFAELGKFCAFVLSVPAAANHPEIKKQLDLLAASKDQLTQAVAEEEAVHKARFAQVAAIQQQVQAAREAHQKKLEELSKPLAPLDGDALARALLKNLGFLS